MPAPEAKGDKAIDVPKKTLSEEQQSDANGSGQIDEFVPELPEAWRCDPSQALLEADSLGDGLLRTHEVWYGNAAGP